MISEEDFRGMLAKFRALEMRVGALEQAHAQTALSVQQTIDALPEKTAAKIETMPPEPAKEG